MKFIRNLIIIFFVVFFNQASLKADTFYLDFKLILNQSDAGKKAQTFLKNKLDNGIKTLQKKEKAIQEEETKIIQQKKVISAEEYKKKVNPIN